MAIEMVEAVCVLVGKPTLCCREDLFVISKVGIAKGAKGEACEVEVGLVGFGVGGWSALIGKEAWNRSACEVGFEVSLGGLERNGWRGMVASERICCPATPNLVKQSSFRA